CDPPARRRRRGARARGCAAGGERLGAHPQRARFGRGPGAAPAGAAGRGARGADADADADAGMEVFDEVNVFLSASETHNRKNVNRSIAESLEGLEAVLGRSREVGLRCEGVISTSFGCPYEGHVPPERVLEIAARLRDAGAQEIGFGDTTGMANPRQVREFFAIARAELGDEVQLTAHFHNTRGQGLA